MQFQVNGENIGDPTAITNGRATLNTAVNGIAGSNTLAVLYEGDATYDQTTSSSIPITVSQFWLTSTGANASVGSAAIATVNVNVANNYTNLINLTCTMPSNLTEGVCFMDPNSITGTGAVHVTVNTTPAHSLSSKANGRPRWLAASGGVSFACVVLLILPRRRWRNSTLSVLAILAIAFTIVGCGGSAKTDPGTAKGTYTVVVTGTAGGGSSQYQTSVNVPITIQ